MENLGDKVASVVQPIARGIDRLFGTRVADCGGCKQMRNNLNVGMSLTDAIIDRWFKSKQEGDKMTYIMQVIVEADNIKDAVMKMAEGEIISINPRPQPPPQRSTEAPERRPAVPRPPLAPVQNRPPTTAESV